MGTEQEKQCTKCQQMKPLGEFGFDSQRQIYRAHCKVCCSEYAKRYRESAPQGKTTQFFVSETERQCTQCLQIKPLARFQIRPDRETDTIQNAEIVPMIVKNFSFKNTQK